MIKQSKTLVFIILVMLTAGCSSGNKAESDTVTEPPESASGNQSLPAIPTLTPTITEPSADEQSAFSSGQIAITENRAWTPVIQEFDGVEMVLVPAGCFMMGSTAEQIEEAFQQCKENWDRCEQDWFRLESPAQQLCFDAPFWIDRTEVTNRQFSALGGQAAGNSHITISDHPREQITWFEAQDFCESRGSRLPTEAEWEYSARGPDSWVYPWGDTFDATRLNLCDRGCSSAWRDLTYDDGYAETAPVGLYPDGASWVGALDLSGNVWEWVSSIAKRYPYDASDGRENMMDTGSTRITRGGSFYHYIHNVRATERGYGSPEASVYSIGFRCARSFSPSDLEPAHTGGVPAIPTLTPTPASPTMAEIQFAPDSQSYRIGDAVSFRFDAGITRQEWVFQGEKGQTAKLSATSDDAKDVFSLILTSSNGDVLAQSRQGSYPSLTATLPKNGQYRISAVRQSSTSPSDEYFLWLQQGPQLKIYLTEFLVGDEARQRVVERFTCTNAVGRAYNHHSAKEGWQNVMLDLVIENIGPIPSTGPDYISGWLIDSGGYTRELEGIFSPFNGSSGCHYGSYDGQYFYPGLRHFYFADTQVPLNQAPETVTLVMDFDGVEVVYEFDVEETSDDIQIPFEVPPSSIPLIENEEISYSVEGVYNLTYSDFYFRENPYHKGAVTLEVNISIENPGGYDLSSSDIESRPYYLAMDNNGEFYSDDAPLLYEDVPPGYVKEGTGMWLVLGRPHRDFDWIWIALFAPDGHPLGQITLAAPEQSEIRDAPF